MAPPTTELIVLVDDHGTAIGTMPKPLVHTGETPLHRAFSAYLFSDDGRLLVTRRARYELGLDVGDLRPALPSYRYRAEFRGVVENEICPVYLGRFSGTPQPDPTEVGQWELLEWTAFRDRQETQEYEAWSPWCREQARLIEANGLLPL